LFFNEIPRATTVAGAAVIVVAGLIALRMAKSDAAPDGPSGAEARAPSPAQAAANTASSAK